MTRRSGVALDAGFERVEEGGVGLRVVEGAALDVEGGDAALGDQEADRAGAGVELRGDPGADLAALLRRRAHQRDVRVVAVERAAGEAVGDGLGRPEVDHVEGAAGADVRDAGAGDGAEAVGAGAEHAAAEVVGDLGGGDVDQALEHAAVGEALHRPAAGAGGVEDERVAVVEEARRRG